MSKSVEDLFKCAPDAATHYIDGAISGKWRDLSGSTWKFFRDSDCTWHDSGDKTSALIHYGVGLKLIPRPQPKPWSGPEDGLPPVGTVCEYQNSLGSWFRVEITAIAKKGICFVQPERWGENYACQVSSKFRPIKTPEQLAAEEREIGITSLVNASSSDDFPGISRFHAARIYDAGFKREVK